MTRESHIRIIFVLLISAVLLQGPCVGLFAQQSLKTPPCAGESLDDFPPFLPGKTLVTFRSNTSPDQVEAMIEAQGMSIIELNQELDLYRMRVSRPVRDAITSVNAYSSVESAIHEIPTSLRPIYAIIDRNAQRDLATVRYVEAKKSGNSGKNMEKHFPICRRYFLHKRYKLRDVLLEMKSLFQSYYKVSSIVA